MERMLKLEVRVEADPEAARLLDEALDLLAESLAQVFLARAGVNVQALPGMNSVSRGATSPFNRPTAQELHA